MKLDDLVPIGITFVVVTIVLAYGADIVDDTRDDMASCDSGFTYNTTANNCYRANETNTTAATTNIEFNITSDSMVAMGNMSTRMGLIATVVVAALVIGVLLSYFAFRK